MVLLLHSAVTLLDPLLLLPTPTSTGDDGETTSRRRVGWMRVKDCVQCKQRNILMLAVGQILGVVLILLSHISIAAAQSGAATTANLSRLLIDRTTNSD